MMKYFTDRTDPGLVSELQAGAVGILRTDTLYGIVARAEDEAAVERVYAIRGRDREKACIVLVASVDDLFDEPHDEVKAFVKSHWPGPFSIALDSPSAPRYLRFHDGTIAYRIPEDEDLRMLLKMTGPLIAPSANPQGEMPAKSIDEAQDYFGGMVDFYADSGIVNNASPSQLWKMIDGKMTRLR